MRAILATLGLVVASLGVGLLVLELLLRLVGYVPARIPAMARMANARWTELLDCYPTNPRGYFDIDLRTPESHDRYFRIAPLRFDRVAARAPWAVESRFNSMKFREKPLLPKTPGVRRVIVLGDSFTEGQGVKEEHTLARRLEARLREGDLSWEVLNCGRRGTDFPALHDAFDEVLPYGPDILVYAFVLNDADQSPAFHARQSYLDDWIIDHGAMVEAPEPPLPGFFEPRLLAFVGDRIASYRVGRETTRWYLEMYEEPNREGWERTKGYIRDMNRRVRERGGRFVLMAWPLLVGLDGRYPFAPIHETVRRFCVTEGIEYLDLLDTFRGRKSESLWVHPIDRHPNDMANALATDALLPVVGRHAER
ncbi:MAG TPA: SGNH/GDSL hydrolase family protein [Vicinamibacteria bacterium]|nr:SGNH/GDSL hydrolase family protein [Vicinamibacteria bacterium]